MNDTTDFRDEKDEPMTDGGSTAEGGIAASIAARLGKVENRWYRLAFFTFLLVWLAYMMLSALPWNWADKLFPFIAGVPAILLVLLKIFKNLFPERYAALKPEAPKTPETDHEENRLEETYKELREESDVARPKNERIAYALRMGAWALVLPLLMYLIGFSNALPLYMLAFGYRFYGSVKMTVIISIVFTALMYGFFYTIIGIPVWDSVLGIPSLVRVLGLA